MVADDLARHSETYLSNVVQRMARGRLLRSHRGIAGGYSLARPAKEITLRDVVELLEGVDINRCNLSLGDVCMAEKRCTMQRRLRELEVGYLKALESVSVGDLAKEVVVPKTPQESQGRRAGSLTANADAMAGRDRGVLPRRCQLQRRGGRRPSAAAWEIHSHLCTEKVIRRRPQRATKRSSTADRLLRRPCRNRL